MARDLHSLSNIDLLDVVQFTEPVIGYSPLTDRQIEVREGAEGTVISLSEDGIYRIEVPDHDSGIPLCFVDVTKDLIAKGV